MASIYDNTSNIYRTDFRSISLTDSGTFSLPSEKGKEVQVFNDSNYLIRVYKTDYGSGRGTATFSGTSDTAGVYLGLEAGRVYTINGLGNAEQVSLQKDNHLNPTLDIKYILSI